MIIWVFLDGFLLDIIDDECRWLIFNYDDWWYFCTDEWWLSIMIDDDGWWMIMHDD